MRPVANTPLSPRSLNMSLIKRFGLNPEKMMDFMEKKGIMSSEHKQSTPSRYDEKNNMKEVKVQVK